MAEIYACTAGSFYVGYIARYTEQAGAGIKLLNIGMGLKNFKKAVIYETIRGINPSKV